MASLDTEAIPPLPRRIWRAAAVTAVWSLGAVPFLLGLKGLARCPSAVMFHAPCPGCGMSRALGLLGHGAVGASLAMHPLAIPTALAQAAVAAASVIVTLERGSPFEIWKTRYGRASIWAVGVVAVLLILLWVARFMGFLGGPVSV